VTETETEFYYTLVHTSEISWWIWWLSILYCFTGCQSFY